MVYSQLVWWRGRGKVESRKYLCQGFWLLRSCIHARAAGWWRYSTILVSVSSWLLYIVGSSRTSTWNTKGHWCLKAQVIIERVKSIRSIRIMRYYVMLVVIITIVRTFNSLRHSIRWLVDGLSLLRWSAQPSRFSPALKLPVEHSILAAGCGRAASCCRHLHWMVSLSLVQPE